MQYYLCTKFVYPCLIIKLKQFFLCNNPRREKIHSIVKRIDHSVVPFATNIPSNNNLHEPIQPWPFVPLKISRNYGHPFTTQYTYNHPTAIHEGLSKEARWARPARTSPTTN